MTEPFFPHLSGESCEILCQLASSSFSSSSSTSAATSTQLQARDRAGPRRTRTANPGSEWSPAGRRLQALDRSGPGKARTANPGSESLRPDLNCKPPPDLNHKESLKICQIECQKECQ